MYDAIVIGGGPAGLQAALTLGRMHRSTLLLDSGQYRNGTVQHMHNVIANDGTPPAEFRATARAQLAEYPDVEIRDIAVQAVAGIAGDFVVSLPGGSSASARAVILATGVADDLPPVDGLAELWGQGAYACPFCDGHEHAGKPIVVLGAAARAEHLIAMLGRFVGDITVVPVGESYTDGEVAALEGRGVRVSRTPVDSVGRAGDGVVVNTTDAAHEVAGIFVASGAMRQRASFIPQLGLDMLESGAIGIDDFGRTSVPGIFAAGDLAHRASLPGPMAAVMMAATAGQLAAVGVIQDLMASEG
ncbi:NAD(P)/FAD-dependent oxidoreductase [Microbacterium sp. 1.5R]|uniref:NAD(P)/FAD-dependent oxidoreductase n=1 Tax=Microbacterium sp. 1.5R TaxID=1916917 RepID=UPI0011A1AC9C|nr:NAD(P)/FAD-dependent oxidoreductase [Microbacterium sp. 1.5R]